MRNEIIKALEYVEDFVRRQEPGSLSQELPGSLPPGDYSYRMSDEARQNLEKLSKRYGELNQCLQSSRDLSDSYAGSPSTIVLKWDAELKHEVVIELTLFGPLAAVFVYGPAPARLLQHIDQCIHSVGLVRLTEDEIKELEATGNYLRLFE